jgi:hypothetical protein
MLKRNVTSTDLPKELRNKIEVKCGTDRSVIEPVMQE